MEIKKERTIRRIFEIYKTFRLKLIVMVLYMTAIAALAVCVPVISGKTFDEMTKLVPKGENGAVMAHIALLAALAFTLWVTSNVMLFWLKERHEAHHLDFAVPKYIWLTALRKLLSFSLGQNISQNSHVKLSIIFQGKDALREVVQTTMYHLVPMLLYVTLVTSYLAWKSWRLAAIVTVSSTAFGYFVWRINKKFRPELKKNYKKHLEADKMFGQITGKIRLIQTCAQEEKALGMFERASDTWMGMAQSIRLRMLPLLASSQLVVGLMIFFVTIVGAWCIMMGYSSVGDIVAYLGLANGVIMRVGSFADQQRHLAVAMVRVRKFFALMDVLPDITEQPNALRPEINGTVEFRDVSLLYHEMTPVGEEDDDDMPKVKKDGFAALSNVSFRLEAGKSYAFVGPSGAGKSTIMNLILRAYDPNEGEVLVEGHDLKLLDLRYYRHRVGVVEQGVELLDTTLGENLKFGLNGEADNVTLEKLEQVTRLACVDKFWDRLEKGFDTEVGEEGVYLSGGERQRVAIARALIKESKILILDEATSSLDAENEWEIQQAIKNASVGRTVIIVAHRLATIRHVDKIFMMEKGRIIGEGRHEELLESCPAYAKLIERQRQAAEIF